MKKKILICSNTLCIGGIEKSLINLLKLINYEKYEVDLILENNIGELKSELPKNVNVIEYQVSDSKNILFRKITNLYKQIKWRIKNTNKYDCSICYATYSYPANLLARLSSKNPIIFVHSDYTKLYSELEFRKFMDTRNFDKFKTIVFVSNEAKDNFLKIYPNYVERSKVINNIIDIDKIIELSQKERKIKFNKENINILYVGRLEENSKNILIQLKTIKDIKNKIPNIRLYILGDGPDKNMYIEYINKNKLENYIELLGQDNNPYPYIKDCDYILLTSNYEGYPVIFNEAIVLKKDIISTIKVSDDYTEVGRNFGFLINKENIKTELENILLNKAHKNIDLDINLINKKRIKKLEELMDEE